MVKKEIYLECLSSEENYKIDLIRRMYGDDVEYIQFIFRMLEKDLFDSFQFIDEITLETYLGKGILRDIHGKIRKEVSAKEIKNSINSLFSTVEDNLFIQVEVFKDDIKEIYEIFFKDIVDCVCRLFRKVKGIFKNDKKRI